MQNARSKQFIIIVVVLLIFLLLILPLLIISGRKAQQEEQGLAIFVTPTSGLPLTITPYNTPGQTSTQLLTFQGFTGEKKKQNGYEYEWGTFSENGSGRIVKALCSAPNSPSPKNGDQYRWDHSTNILVPLIDNKWGNVQRFWYPEYKN